ncbi:melatonin receptor type 1B-A-like [Tubulanus polymorphus]|uniref:melatonin receptor type 1B-A-like n=1 Tax=Tubulanus polymorphus TaxID=672921 RepID=UPI003DA32CCF
MDENGSTENMTYIRLPVKTTENATVPEMIPTRLVAVIAVIIMSVFLLVGILGTIWILTGLLRRTDMRGQVVNIFIVSLCINDLLNLFNQVFVILSYIEMDWRMGKLLCAVVPEFSMFIAGSSLWHHAFIAIHRYIVVCQNNMYRRLSKQVYVAVVMVVTRIIPLCFVIPAFIIDMTIYVPKLLRCVFSPVYGQRTIAVLTVIIFIPFMVVSICFSVIFCFIHRAGRTSRMRDRTVQHEIQITKMFAVVFLVFFIGYIPYGMIRVADRDGQLSPDAYVIVTALYAIASSLNPIIYGGMNRSIRDACLDLSKCLKYLKHPNYDVNDQQNNGNIRLYLTNTNNCNEEPKTSDSLLARLIQAAMWCILM